MLCPSLDLSFTCCTACAPRAQVWNFIRVMNVPYNVLHEKGFISIGCEPCTKVGGRVGGWVDACVPGAQPSQRCVGGDTPCA